jgi:hypothetical protein
MDGNEDEESRPRQHKINLPGGLGPEGGLVADKPARPPLAVEATDEAGVTEDVVVDGHGSGSEAIRIARGGLDDRSASVDRSADGSLDVAVSGSLPRKQRTELRTARLLVEHLYGAGAAWEPPVSSDEERKRTGAAEDGVDCVSRGPDGELRIQVTTPETKLWRELASVTGSEATRASSQGGSGCRGQAVAVRATQALTVGPVVRRRAIRGVGRRGRHLLGGSG